MESSANPGLNAALDQLWERFLPAILERVSVLEAAAAACVLNNLTKELKEEAHAAAHKLAGTLGTFNLDRGTVLARELELIYAMPQVPDHNLTARLASHAIGLRRLVENRPKS